jgi:hypothetical protein
MRLHEIADQLAKEAAKEAEALEVSTQVFTKQDIRKAAVTKTWQVRWDSSNSGRKKNKKNKINKAILILKSISLLDEIRQSWKEIFHIWRVALLLTV